MTRLHCGSGEFCNSPAAPGHYVCEAHLEQLLPSIERFGFVKAGSPVRCLVDDCRHAADRNGYCQEHRAEARKAKRAAEAARRLERETEAMVARVMTMLSDEPLSRNKLAKALDVSPTATAFRDAIKRLIDDGRAEMMPGNGLRLAPPPVVARAQKIGRLVSDSDAPLTNADLERELKVSRRTLTRAVREAETQGWIEKLPGRTARHVSGPTPLAA